MTANDPPLRESNRPPASRPFFSICIPQYNRTDFLIESLRTYASQSFRDFEVCISDDCSNDGREQDLFDAIRGFGFAFVYARTPSNLRYDGNLRSAIGLSRGRYLLLMGNDDSFSDVDTLQTLHDELMRHEPVAAAITNYREVASGQVYRRMTITGVLGGGPGVAVSTFRRYSFVSGVILEGDGARAETTDSCDGSEMYQMYLGARLVGRGGRFLSIDRVCIDKDIQIPGQDVDSYRLWPRVQPCPIVERPLPMGRLLEVVATGLAPCHAGKGRERDLLGVCSQLYRFIYPYWVVEYRRVQSWPYALGVLLAVRPARVARGLDLSVTAMLRLWATYLAMGAVALTVPIGLFDALRPQLYAFAKRLRLA